jgi:SAM-dependent methyltransferase
VVQGVDPAENLAEFSTKNEIPTLVAYWGLETAKRLDSKYDAVVAQNVLAHLPYPHEFLLACKSVLSEDGRMYLQTSQSEMFLRNEFDTIYHEHHSFYSARSMKTLAERAGLFIVDTYKVPVHGTSYVFVLGRTPQNQSAINKLVDAEASEGRYNVSTYFQFAKNAQSVTSKLAEVVKKYQNAGTVVIGFGAAAKGMTLLNFGKIKLDYIVDDNTLKWDLLTPGMNIPIRDPNVLKDEPSAVAFAVLAWNFFTEIRAKIKKRRPHQADDFIQYFPDLKIIK